MLHHIASLVDFSKHSKISLRAAANLAQESNASLHVLHVTEPVTAFASEGELLYHPQQTVTELTRELKTWVNQELQKNAPQAKLGKVEVVFGPVLPNALEWCAKQHADLIVIGTHGHTGLTHLLLGSIAEKIIRHSTIPVLTVKDGHPLPPKRVLVPVDLSDFSKEALLLAERFCDKIGAKLELAHIINMGDIVRLNKFLKTEIDTKEFLAAAEAYAAQRIQRLIGRKTSDIKIHIEEGEVSHVVNKLVKARKIDLIILPTHGHTGLKHMLIGSTAERIVRTCSTHCLSFCPAKLKSSIHELEM